MKNAAHENTQILMTDWSLGQGWIVYSKKNDVFYLLLTTVYYFPVEIYILIKIKRITT